MLLSPGPPVNHNLSLHRQVRRGVVGRSGTRTKSVFIWRPLWTSGCGSWHWLDWWGKKAKNKTKQKKRRRKNINNRVRRSKNISTTIKIDGMMLFSSLQWFLETPVCGCFGVAIKRNFPSDVGKIRSATGVGGWAIWDQTAVWAMEDFPHKATHDTRKEIACDECVITVLCLCDHSECFVFIWFRSYASLW